MIDTKLLRQKLIDMALRGLLVEQRPEDGHATDLLEQIRAEKAALIKEGKIKKEKPLPEIKEEEKPFAIPANWCWVRLGECTSYTQTKEKISAKDISPDAWSLDLEDIEKETGKIVKYCTAGQRGIIGDKVVFHKGQVLYSKLRPYLKKILVAPNDGVCTSELVPFCAYGEILSQFIVYLLKTSYVDYVTSIAAYGTNMPRVGKGIMPNLLVPLPPLAEQKRIVTALESCLKLVDTIAKDSADLDKALKFLRQKMLDMAVRGQLVEQRPEDGNATDLLEQIRAEKAALIKAGKIKKEKPLPEIKEEDKPFAIPANWCWVRLGEIGSWCAGSTPPRNYPDYYKGNIPWLKTGDLNDNFIEKVPEFVSDLALQDCSLRLNPVGSVLIAMYGATIGKLGILRVPMTTNQACCACVPFDGLFNLYLFYFLMANKARFVSQGAGGAQPNISKEKIIRFPMPLPPLAEQKRIVAKLEQINALIETMLN